MEFSKEELEMIEAIRNINNDQNLDAYECLEVWKDIVEWC